jgi:glycosyltransferase involved in cell wall biosynthesis
MKTIGGSLFIRNAIQFDYCVEASIRSLLPLCDQIVVLDCQSTDGTQRILRELAKQSPKIRLIENVKWECAENYDRLRVLANLAISFLKTDWHFMIQADEVLHEKSIPILKAMAELPCDDTWAVAMRRPHVFGNMDHYIRHDLEPSRKPASDYVIRFGRRHHQAVGDAESIVAPNVHWLHKDQIVLFHYGYVRKNSVNLTKVMDMQSWFHGKGSKVDKRILDMHKKDGVFRPEGFFAWNELVKLDLSHPLIAKEWVDERRSEYPFEPPQDE